MLFNKYKKLTTLFALLSLVYLVQAAFLPADSTVLSKHHLSSGERAAIIFAVALPYTAISFVALVGYLRLRTYVETIRGSRDGEAFNLIAIGVFWLALWLPVSAVISMATTAYIDIHRTATITMSNLRAYYNVLLLMPAFWLIMEGSRRLLKIVRIYEKSLPQYLIIIFLSFAAIYTGLSLHNPARQFPSHVVFNDNYYLSDWLIVLTIVIPRLITWFWGMRAVYNIYLFRKKLKAPIYRHALTQLASGLVVVLVTLSLLRSTQTLSSWIGHESVGIVVLAVYLLLILLAVGYTYIARGSQGLQKIEEI